MMSEKQEDVERFTLEGAPDGARLVLSRRDGSTIMEIGGSGVEFQLHGQRTDVYNSLIEFGVEWAPRSPSLEAAIEELVSVASPGGDVGPNGAMAIERIRAAGRDAVAAERVRVLDAIDAAIHGASHARDCAYRVAETVAALRVAAPDAAIRGVEQ